MIVKKIILSALFCFLIANISQASIYGEGTHMDINDDFLSAFENCTPYEPQVPEEDTLAKNDIPEEYDSIQVLGEKNGMCFFDLIMQMSSERLYTKMIKRCKITPEQRETLLDAIKDINKNKGRKYMKAIADIMDQCVVVYDQ